MNGFLAQNALDLLVDTVGALVSMVSPLGAILGWLLLWLLPILGFCYLVYYLLSLPMRRRERARLFLDLIETGLKRGQSPEQTIVAAAASEDPILGVRFQMLAAYIENGLRLDQALEKVPRLLPPETAAILKTGLAIGDLPRVLPTCRKQLKDGVSQARGALNYVLVMVFMVMPVFPFFFFVVWVWVIPRFRDIYQDMLPGTALPAAWLFHWVPQLIYLQIGLTLLLQVLAVCYVGGPRLTGWIKNWVYPFTDGLVWRLPWRRKRMQRDFSSMLALLLDTGLSEAKAVQLAASSTANRLLEGRAQQACAALAEGTPLVQAVQRMDDTGELAWRLGNVAQSRQGFLAGLAGWIEALDAKAFQQEQATAQLLTTGLILLNGLVVGSFAVGVFMILTTLITGAALW
ncbi:MAG: type II secretion system F family protein [Verrucomicrobia bacterium]|nr:type II secretion system F family protein [Verrucomicrobiota bacterium]